MELETVVETGVAYGATSASILTALHKNGKGVLHPLGRTQMEVPALSIFSRDHHTDVPLRYPVAQGRQFHAVLPWPLATSLDGVDVFLHDSANIYQVQKTELEAVWPRISARAAILVNHIGKNPAFAEFVREKKVDRWLAIEQQEKKGVLTGVILKSLLLQNKCKS